MRILLVEDDEPVANFVREGLTREAFAVDVALDGRTAFLHALDENYDLIILDVLIPHIDGLELLAELRKHGRSVPVLMLSAKASVADRVLGLSTGADDYLVKPFAFPELLARIQALLRRPPAFQPACVSVGGLELDFAAHRVTRDGVPLHFTPREFSLLEYLIRNRGTVLTRAMIAEHVWDQHFDSFGNTIDVYIRYLRDKLEAHGTPRLIHTVRGVGYLFSTEPP
jgi:two-component system copper resistance phosphate regulon response regulator CusR